MKRTFNSFLLFGQSLEYYGTFTDPCLFIFLCTFVLQQPFWFNWKRNLYYLTVFLIFGSFAPLIIIALERHYFGNAHSADIQHIGIIMTLYQIIPSIITSIFGSLSLHHNIRHSDFNTIKQPRLCFINFVQAVIISRITISKKTKHIWNNYRSLSIAGLLLIVSELGF